MVAAQPPALDELVHIGLALEHRHRDESRVSREEFGAREQRHHQTEREAEGTEDDLLQAGVGGGETRARATNREHEEGPMPMWQPDRTPSLKIYAAGMFAFLAPAPTAPW